MANIARFTINASASSPPGFDGTISQVLTFALEGGPSNLAVFWTLEVYSAGDPKSPRASKNAPSLTLVGATSGQKVNAATPGSSITTTLPGSGVHSWIIRSTVNGGFDAKGNANPDYVYERIVAIKTGSGLRKSVVAESTQYSAGGWSDAQNDLIDAGAGPLLAPGGAGDANKVAAASGAGTNLQYAAGVFLDSSGTALGFGGTRAASGTVRGGTTFNIVGLIGAADRAVLTYSGGVAVLGDQAGNGAAVHAGVGGFQIFGGSDLIWAFDKVGTNIARLRCFIGSDALAAIHPEPDAAATSTTRTKLQVSAQDKSGTTNVIAGTLHVRGGDAQGSGGTQVGGDLLMNAGWALGSSGTRSGGNVQISPGVGATAYGNTYFGTDYNVASTNWQGAMRMLLVQNRIQLPSGDAPDGHFYGSDGGNPWWRFSGTSLRLDGTATTANAGAQTLPSNPVGFISVTLNGTVRKIPYYAT